MEHISKELNIGRAGEYLTLADLILKGEKAFQTAQGVNYDIVVDFGRNEFYKKQIIRLQVKTTQKIKEFHGKGKAKAYFFQVRRAGKGSNRFYDCSEFEGFALVALDKRQVYYYPFENKTPNAIVLRDRELGSGAVFNGKKRKARYLQDYSWEKFKERYII